jgi:catechol 2,3-dioxygenase-like lactoylglutathione lyase family enzyme
MTAIKHIEFLVSDFEKTMNFYAGLFDIIGWTQVSENGFKINEMKIYFKENKDLSMQKSLGPRHICFQASDRAMVDQVGTYLVEGKARMIRGPLEVSGEKYSKGYYTVDFYDPDGYILEVAHSPASN